MLKLAVTVLLFFGSAYCDSVEYATDGLSPPIPTPQASPRYPNVSDFKGRIQTFVPTFSPTVSAVSGAPGRSVKSGHAPGLAPGPGPSVPPSLSLSTIESVQVGKLNKVVQIVQNCTKCPPASKIEDAGPCANPFQGYQACSNSPGSCCPVGWSCVNSLCLPGDGSPSAQTTTCGNGNCDSGETCSTCPQDCTRSDGSPCSRVGIMYEAWHLPAVYQASSPFLTVEDVLRSRQEDVSGTIAGAHALTDALTGSEYYWHSTPAGGIYCIYHSRVPGSLHFNPIHESKYLTITDVPDCANWQATVQRHATQLVAAGVDHIVLDSTNLVQYDAFADAISLRPLEILFEEWAALRAQGTQTPDISVWCRIPNNGPFGSQDKGSIMYSYMLDIYNIPAYENLVLKTRDGHKIFWYPDLQDFDLQYLNDIASNNNLGGISTVPMWINRQAASSASFEAFCSAPPFISDSPCAQQATTQTTGLGGTQLAVSPSYQLTYASLPWRDLGVLGGLLFRKQFETAFELQPDWIFISAWNERIALLVGNGADPGYNKGLEDDTSISGVSFTDMHGVAFSRDIEPTDEYGTLLLDLMTSCLRVFRSGARSCSDTTEACCSGGTFSQNYAYFDEGDSNYNKVFGYAIQDQGSFTALYQCGDGSLSATGCGGQQLGWISPSKGGIFLRSLRICNDGSYTLLNDCSSGAKALLGYVW